MDQAFATVIGMSIAYVASFIGMGLAWYGWKRRAEGREGSREGDAGRGGGSTGGGRDGGGP